jgi:hypothetical protein
VFIGARSDPELKAAQAQKSELSRDELREFLTEVSSQTWARRILQSIAAFVRALGLLPESSLLGVKFKFSLRQTLSGEIRGRPHSPTGEWL